MEQDGLPNSFVPGRNLLFFTFAAAVAWRRGIRQLVGGMCETDFSGYPDCRDNTIKSLQVALNLGMDRSFVLQTPLMWLDKAETWALAQRAGRRAADRDPARAHPHLLSQASAGRMHDWGHGCGECPACALRKRGFENWRKSAVMKPRSRA